MSIFTSIKHHAVISTVIGFLIIFVAVVAGRAASHKAPVADTHNEKAVTLINASTFRQGNVTIGASGVVESHAQVDLKSQTSAPISVINVSIGQNVYPGTVILELANADIRAQLAQAEASLALAKGQYSTGALSVESAKQAAIDRLRDAYNKTYDAIVSQAEPILFNNDGNGGHLTTLSPDTSTNSEITTTDVQLKSAFPFWKQSVNNLTTNSSIEEIESVIQSSQKYMVLADTLLSDMTKVLNVQSPYATPAFGATLSGWKAIVSGAHSSLSGAVQALTAAESGLTSSNSAQGATAPAQVAVAQAGVNNLRAQLAKTIITSPISGKVSALPLREGELASPGSLVASVIGNDSGLTIKSYVSGDDLARLAVGASVTIGTPKSAGNASATPAVTGIVSNIAPGVDAITRKAEVDIDVNNPTNSGLVIGQNVSVSITPKAGSVTTNPSQLNSYLLPIQNVKIVPGAAYVYTVDENNKIVQKDVVLGPIQGDFVIVQSGLNDDMNIVSPVYELQAGDTVRVQ